GPVLDALKIAFIPWGHEPTLSPPNLTAWATWITSFLCPSDRDGIAEAHNNYRACAGTRPYNVNSTLSAAAFDIVEVRAMKRVLMLACVSVGVNPGGAARAADGPMVLDVWPGKPAGDHGRIGPERVRAPAEAPTADAKWITNVTRPTISVFR